MKSARRSVGLEGRRSVIDVRPAIACAVVLLCGMAPASLARGSQPQESQRTSLGPQVGSAVPSFSGVDQFGRTHTLESTLGAKGAMLVFYRSADW